MNRNYPLPVIAVLVACLIAAWAYRFAPIDGALRVGVDSLVLIGAKPDGLRQTDQGMLMTTRVGSPGSASFAIPGVDGAGHWFVRIHAVARDLAVGPELWDDGRLFLEWMDGGGVVGISAIHSARGNWDWGRQIVVISSPVAGAVPVLRFQNLGVAGTYELVELEIVAARERNVWACGKWLLAAGFLTTIAALAGGTKKPARWRGWVAALIWMIVAVAYAFPGPWDAARPFVVPFVFAEVPLMESGNDQGWQISDGGLGADEPHTKRLPPPNDIGLRLRLWLPWLRPILHLALLAAPVFAMAWFVGARCAMWLGLSLSVSIEAAQVMYGFGFGWDDVIDLIVNAIGIAAAVWAHRRFAKRVHSRLPFRFPEPG